MMRCTNLQFKYSFVKRLRRRLGVRIFNHELQRAQNCVEETIDDDFVDVIDVRFPDVTVFVGIQQFTILLTQTTAISRSPSATDCFDTAPDWARCRISPPRFLAECRKRRLNQGGFVSAVCLVVCFL